MKTSTKDTGNKGEDEASSYLKSQGHSIVARNWRFSHLEIDIITIKDNVLHFVEVKSRTAPAAADPGLNVDRNKRRHMEKAASAFLASGLMRSLPVHDPEIFFDIVTVVFEGDGYTLEYYPQAFIPIYA